MISVYVQHHPARAGLLPSLTASLRPFPVEVVTDPEPDEAYPSPWRTYRLCLERAAQSRRSHSLIVQDDAEVCDRFTTVLPRVVRARPEQLICLWVGGLPARTVANMRYASMQGAVFADVDVNAWLPVVATVWPREIARRAVWYATHRLTAPERRSDDANMGEFIRLENISAVATIPSLVEHPDREPSLIGRHARAGADVSRVAAIPPDGTVGDIRWA